MSRVWAWMCDGCGRISFSPTLPKGWQTYPSWDNGSVTYHYCERHAK